MPKCLLFSIILFFSLFSNAQNSDEFYLDKVGYEKAEVITKNDTVVFLISKNNLSNLKPTIVFLQGSMPLPLVFHDEISTNTIIPFSTKEYVEKFNFVIVARKGVPLLGTYDRDSKGYVNEKGDIPELYTKNNNLNYRVNQVKEVLSFLSKNNRFKNKPIFVLGHSEGYRVAAKLAENKNKIAKLVCLSADPFNRLSESILRERINGFLDYKNDSVQFTIDKLTNDFKKIPLNKVKFKDNVGFNNWVSYNDNLSYESLKKYKKPILVVYGTADIGSIHNDLLPFLISSSNLKIKAYPNYGHNFEKKEFGINGEQLETSYHWDEVFKDIVEWLMIGDL